MINLNTRLSKSIFSLTNCLFTQKRFAVRVHKALAKRFIKRGSGYKRKQSGRNHGNGNFSHNSLRHLDKWVAVTKEGGHLKKLRKFLQK